MSSSWLAANLGSSDGSLGCGSVTKKSSLNASSAEMRALGSSDSILSSSADAPGALRSTSLDARNSRSWFPLYCPGFRFAKNGSLETPGKVSSVGVPSIRQILSTCAPSSAPANRGFPRSSSAQMHPTDHMSTSGP